MEREEGESSIFSLPNLNKIDGIILLKDTIQIAGKAQEIEEQLVGKKGKLPEAIAVANDCMAIGLCNALTKHGYRVPEDIAVASYDSTEEGRTSPSPITSVMIPAEECGVYAAEYMNSLFAGRKPEPFTAEPKLIHGHTEGEKRISIVSTCQQEQVFQTPNPLRRHE